MATPMPLLAPVTTATLPVRPRSITTPFACGATVGACGEGKRGPSTPTITLRDPLTENSLGLCCRSAYPRSVNRSAVGEYLRARRELLSPADVGLPQGERRRVHGLRRSEVAMLAGISPDYYLRLEQGRDGPPSDQVLTALGRALLLDDEGLEYLHHLAHPVRGHSERSADHRVDDALLRLMALWTGTPAVVIDGCMDVLVSNPLAAALAPGIFEPGGNLVLAIFEPLSRQAAPDWEELAGRTVASLRLGADPDDPRLHDIVGELSTDPDFSRLWARHDVQAFTTGTTTHYVADIGFIQLQFQNLAVPGRSGLVLTTYFADEGSPGERALAHLSAQIDLGITVPAVQRDPGRPVSSSARAARVASSAGCHTTSTSPPSPVSGSCWYQRCIGPPVPWSKASAPLCGASLRSRDQVSAKPLSFDADLAHQPAEIRIVPMLVRGRAQHRHDLARHLGPVLGRALRRRVEERGSGEVHAGSEALRQRHRERIRRDHVEPLVPDERRHAGPRSHQRADVGEDPGVGHGWTVRRPRGGFW